MIRCGLVGCGEVDGNGILVLAHVWSAVYGIW